MTPGREAAARAVWQAGSPGGVKPGSPRRRALVLHAGVATIVASALYALGHRSLAWVPGLVAALGLVAAVVSPDTLGTPLLRAAVALGRVLSRLMAWLLLWPVFIGFFAVFGRLTRRGRGDRLERHFDRTRDTYWKPCEPSRSERAALRRLS